MFVCFSYQVLLSPIDNSGEEERLVGSEEPERREEHEENATGHSVSQKHSQYPDIRRLDAGYQSSQC